MALSREEVVSSGIEDAEELTALAGSGVVAAIGMAEEELDAKRMPAPFRIKVFGFNS